jgi:hypothetical protein
VNRPLPHGGFRAPTPAERYADLCTQAEGLLRFEGAEWLSREEAKAWAWHIIRHAQAQYMSAGAAFRYADLPPLVHELIACQHPGLQPEPDSLWRWPGAQTQQIEPGIEEPA